MLRLCIIFFWLVSALLARGQLIPVLQDATDWSDNEVLAEDLLEMQQDVIVSFAPFNLNDTTDLLRMLEVSLISAEEHRRLKAHLRRYGSLLHPYELYHCGIFTAEWLQRMEPVTCLSSGRSKTRNPKGLHSLRGEIRSRLKRTGSDSLLRLLSVTRISGRLGNKTDIALVYAKGAGEPFLASASPLQPEHLSGFVRWRSSGILRQLVVGDFQFQGGSGLRYGKGWAPSDARYPLADAMLPARLVARTSSVSSITLKGIAAEWRKGFTRLNISSGAQFSDGYYRMRNGTPDWSEGGGGDHSTPRYAARREQSSLLRHSVRLGMEKEWLRLGLSWDQISVAGMDSDAGRSIRIEEESIGMDMQWVARHQELWLELVRFRQAQGLAFSWINGRNDWIGLRAGGSFQEGSLPFSSGQTSLADVSESAQMDLYAAASLSWGRGWSLRSGLRNEQSWMPAGEMQLKSRLFAKIERSIYGGGYHSLLADVRLPEQTGANDPETRIQRIRLMYRGRIHSGATWQWSGGWHLANDHSQAEAGSVGLAWYLSSRYGRPGKKLCYLDAAIAWHQLDNAETRAWFWFGGAEGRMLLQSLNGRGGRASFSGCWQWTEKCKAMAGLSYRHSLNKDGEASTSLELGMRIQFQW